MEDKKNLLEIYKIHAKFSDSVMERRGATNKFYVSILSAIFAFLTFALDAKALNLYIIILCIALLGVLLCIIWYFNIKAYRQLNKGKFSALYALEDKLDFAFYKKEWEFLGKGKDKKKYIQLSVVEQYAPITLSIPYIVLFIYALAQLLK